MYRRNKTWFDNFLDALHSLVLHRYHLDGIASLPLWTVFISLFQTLYLVSLVSWYGFAPLSENPYFGPPFEVLIDYGGNVQYLTKDEFQIWRLFTYSMLHAGFVHLIANLMLQLTIGWYLETIWGSFYVFLVYILSGIGAGIWSIAFQSGVVSIGPSGCITAWIAMCIVESVVMKEYLKHPKAQFIVFLCGWFSIFLTGYMKQVDNFVHTFGFLFGICISFMLIGQKYHPTIKRHFTIALFSLFLVSLTVIGLTLLFFVPDFECKACCYALGSYTC